VVAGNGGADTCGPITAVSRGILLTLADVTPSNHRSTDSSTAVQEVIGLAADGVTTVQATYPHNQTVTATVTHNVFSFQRTLALPQRATNSIVLPFPQAITLKLANGQVLRRTALPPGREQINNH
jgi:hypothetical protein